MAGLQGRVFGGYRLAEQMASGGIAEVYRARPIASGGREVVVKVIFPEFARQPGFHSNFRNIVQMAAKLLNHPHVLPVLASGEEGGYLYLVTPYVAHGTLRDWLQAGNRLGPTDVGPFFRQLCGAIAYAHSLGIVHSNLKLSNIFLYEGRHVLVGDFGLLWDISHLDMNHTGSGTDAVEFLAPEGFSGSFTQQSDIYALGALLFATLAGFPPFQGRKPADLYSAHTQHPVPRLAQVPQLAAPLLGLDNVIQRAMAKRPEDRFPSAMALTQAIEGALRQPLAAAPAQAGRAPLAGGMAAPVHYPAGQPGIPPVAPPFPGNAGYPQAANAPFAAMTPATPGLRQLDPPFPPLGSSQHVEANMEQGREWPALPAPSIPPSAMAGQQRPAFAAPADDSVRLRTAVVPKPTIAPNPRSIPVQPPAPPFDAGNGAAAHGIDLDAAEDLGPPKMPAIRPQGLAGAALGGSAASAYASIPEEAPLGDDRFDGGANFHRALALRDNSQEDWSSPAPWQGEEFSFGDASMSHSGAFAKPAFSATELDLPRLTNPALEGQLPPEWEDLLADEFASQRAARERGRNGSYAPDYGNGQMHASVYPSDDYGQGYSQWSGQAAGSSMDWSAQYPATYMAPERTQLPQWEQPPQRSAPAYPSDAFSNQQGWTAGEAAGQPRRRWLRWLLLTLLLFTVATTSLLIAKPELCPTAVCAEANRFVRSHLPLVGSQVQDQLLFVPASLDLKTTVGDSTRGSLQMTNSSAIPLTWQATTDLLWLTVVPTGGTLDPGATTLLTVTAQPIGVNPNTYRSTLLIAVGDSAAHFPVAVVVAAGPRLSASPRTMAFTTCNTAQKLTVRNTGGGPLTFNASPSSSSALKLSITTATLDPGQTSSISVTVDCTASVGNYSVNLVSNGGSTRVAVQYT
jgi:hypothetical protein